MMNDKKMYSVNQMVNLPTNILVSDAMYKMNAIHNIPKNIKEIYYQNRSPESQSMNEEMNNLKVRQENILQKLTGIKEKLNSFKGNKMIPLVSTKHTPSSADINKLICERKEESSNLIKKIETFKHLLLDSQDGQNEQNDKDIEEWQHFILEQLTALKFELNFISERNQQFAYTDQCEDLKQKQNYIVELIAALQTLLKSEISSWQNDVQKHPSNVSVEGYHAEVLVLIARLRKEFETIAKALSDLENKVENEDRNISYKYALPMKKDFQYCPQVFSFLQKLETTKVGVLKDLVICANSSRPPYFLLAIKKILEPSLRVLMSSKVHSSSSEVDPVIFKLFQNDDFEERGSHDVAFTIIWKNQEAKSLMINPLSHCAIVGEGNILRYLARFFSAFPSLNYEQEVNVVEVSLIDMWIDIIQTKLLHASIKERQSALKQFNARLGTSEWVNGASLGLCDIFLWSVVLQLGICSELPSNVAKWFTQINKLFGFNFGKIIQEPQETEKVRVCVDRFSLEMFLKKHNIEFQSRDHEELFTVDALLKHVKDMPGIHMKNLFLKDRKNNLYLLSARYNAQIKLSEVGNKIGVKDLRFADEDTLQKVLGVTKGCVTIFALLNDPEHKVKVLLDSEVVKSGRWEYINFHPMVNSASLGISPQDLDIFLKLTGHEIHLLDFISINR